MKKTLVLTENFPPTSGGSGRWFWELYSRLPREKVIIVANDIPEAKDFDQTHDLNVIRMHLKSPEWGLKSIKGIKFYWRCIKKIKKLIKEHNIEEIHCGRVIHEGVTAWLIKLLTGTPYLCFIHGEDVETAATSREHNLMVKQVCKHSNLLICNSYNTLNITERLSYSKPSEREIKTHVLHPGVDTERFHPAPPDLVFKKQMGWDNRKVIITVGRLQKRKGQDLMIQAMPEILKTIPEALYVIIGRGECQEELEKLVEKHALEEYVHIRTDIDDETMIKCYQQCDLFILPNRTIGNDIEGFGMVLVEAQACGKPVIAGDSGGTKETMLVGETGLIVDCTKEINIKDSVINVLASNKLNNSCISKIRDFTFDNFHWDAHTKKALKVFK